MNFTIPWDTAFEQAPQGTESISGGDDRIRELKTAIRERVQEGWWEEITAVAYESPNRFSLSGNSTTRYVTGRGLLCTLSSGDVAAIVKESSFDGSKTVVTITGNLLNSTLSKIYFGPTHSAIGGGGGGGGASNLHFFIQGDAQVDYGIVKILIGGDLTVTEVVIWAEHAPSGTDLIVDVTKNESSIFGGSADQPAIAPGENLGASSAISTPNFTTGDIMGIDIAQTGNADPGGNPLLVTVVCE
jgi:hypothetical protein